MSRWLQYKHTLIIVESFDVIIQLATERMSSAIGLIHMTVKTRKGF